MPTILSWLGQYSTILGAVGSSGVVTGLLTGTMTWQQALPVLVGSLVAIIMPENAAAATTAKAAATDVEALVTALVAKPIAPAPIATPAPVVAPSPASTMATFAAQLAPHLAAAMASTAAPSTPIHGMGAP